MNLKEQQYVCTLARCQSLSRAAEELFISPSALSVYISNLEKYLGVRLFERTGRGKAFVLTSIGEEYVVRAEKMLELKAEFDGLVENELHKSYPAIRVGIQQRRAISIVPEALQRFMEKYPDVDVIFRDGNLGDLTCMYREGSVDFMVSIFRDELPDAVCQEIAKEPVLLALPDTHPAVSYAYSVEVDIFPHLDIRHLDRETFIVPMQDQSMRRTANYILERARIRPGRIIEIGHFDVILSMVNQGLGIGFNRLGYISDMQKFEHVRYFLINRESYQSSLVLVYRKGHVISECEKYLLDILVETIRSRYEQEATEGSGVSHYTEKRQ